MEKNSLEFLKIHLLSRANLSTREMNHLRGGSICPCGCQYSGTSSSTELNGDANHNGGYTVTGTKPGGTIACYTGSGKEQDEACKEVYED